jgi:hypothetical protein
VSAARRLRAIAALFTAVLLAPGARPCDAASRRVPLDFATIQGALDASNAGDSVLVEPGVYAERLVLRSGVTLRAVGAAGSATVDAQELGACAVATFCLPGTRLEGFRLVAGRGHDDGGALVGGALRVLGGSLEVNDCAFENSFADFGGGAAVQSASVTFTRCVWKNVTAAFGGGLFQAGGSVRLVDVVLEDVAAEEGGGAYVTMGGQLVVDGGRFTRSNAQRNGGGFHVESAVLALSNARVDGAVALQQGGGIAVRAGGQVIASFSVFVDNQSGQGGGAFHVSCTPSSLARSRFVPGMPGTAPAADCALLDLTNVDVIACRGAAPAAGGVTDAAALRMRRSIVAGNASGLACLDSRATLEVTCSALYGNGGADLTGSCAPPLDPANRSEDPHLCDLVGRDFHLCANSPLLDPGCGEPFWGAFGEGCAACGPTPASRASWGRLKALYHR